MENYKTIADHYKQKFTEHGDTPQGYDWSNEDDMRKRYLIMRGLFNIPSSEDISVLDFGCGAGGFYEYVKNFPTINYTGIDINERAINAAGVKYPETPFGVLDIHDKEGWEIFNNPRICKENYDYVIMNGVFTVRNGLSQDEMSCFLCNTLDKLWLKCNKGMAFNLMSNLVDWKRDDLYHVSMDQICQYLVDNFSRNFVIRNDYNLYEYTIYLYK